MVNAIKFLRESMERAMPCSMNSDIAGRSLREYVELGQVPWEERPSRMAEPGYRINALRECEAFIQAIRNYVGYEPTGACLAWKAFPQEAGVEYQVVCFYDEKVPDAVQYARRCERQVPATWEE